VTSEVASTAPSSAAWRSGAKLRSFYFLYYAAVGVIHPFLAPYLRGLGLSGDQMGTVQMWRAAAAVPALLLWGAISDRLGAVTRALQVASIATFAAASWLPWARQTTPIVLVMIALGLVSTTVAPLADVVTVESARRTGGASYARIRALGSVGYICASTGLGLLLAARGDLAGDPAVPFAYALLALSFAVVTLALPALPPPERSARLADLVPVLRDRRLIVLLLAGAVHSACMACYELFGVLIRDAGLPARITGLGMAFGVCAEVLALMAFPWLERRVRLGTLFAVSFGATSLRWYLLSRSHVAALLIGLQVLHGASFGVYWASSVRAVSEIFPSRLRATGQALFTAVALCIGGAVGYRLAGFGYDRLGGAAPVYAWAAGVELVPLCLALVLRINWT
jgi:MFS transporter, PPP family, 3-phenylpropionic acid transporter